MVTTTNFGLKPKKTRTPLTIDQMAAAAAKRTATRASRHTMGTKQRKDVKGTITTIVTPQPAAAPAPVAPSRRKRPRGHERRDCTAPRIAGSR